jgi:hypothetical protein
VLTILKDLIGAGSQGPAEHLSTKPVVMVGGGPPWSLGLG